MKTKWIVSALMAGALVMAGSAMTGCKKSEQRNPRTAQYTCTMHPEVVQDKPGDCPKCGMKLVEKR